MQIFAAVVDQNDRVIIQDVDYDSGTFPPPSQVYVFNADGTYRTKIGRTGSGPGEYLMAGLVGVKAGNVLLIDISNHRLHVFDADDYSLVQTSLFDDWSVRDHEAVKDMRFSFFDARNDGNLLASFREIVPTSGSRLNIKLVLVDLDGNIIDPVPREFRGGFSFNTNTNPPRPSMLTPQMMGSTIYALSADDYFYSMWTREFLIKKYDADGVYQSAIYYPVSGSPFDVEDYVGMFGFTRHNILRGIENSDEKMPETNPVASSIRIDDENRIWVAVPMDPQRVNYEWWILAPSGELLAKLQRPRDETIYDIQNEFLYGKKINEETGAEYVVKYRIELNLSD